jgi:hypothetical protein
VGRNVIFRILNNEHLFRTVTLLGAGSCAVVGLVLLLWVLKEQRTANKTSAGEHLEDKQDYVEINEVKRFW